MASGSSDNTIKVWEVSSGKLLHTFEGHSDAVYSVAFDKKGLTLASGSGDKTIKVWELSSGKLLHTLEGHNTFVRSVCFDPQERFIVSQGVRDEGTICLWDYKSRAKIAVIPERNTESISPQLIIHPNLPILAAVGSYPDIPGNDGDTTVHIYQLDLSILYGQPITPTVTYTSAKIVLLGDSGVGKTGLGWRLAHGGFKEHSSTHGQQFWLLDQLRKKRKDGTECEAILWDLAGQDDYRMIHALFLDDADLALLLYDPTHPDNQLNGVDFWLKQLREGRKDASKIQIVLVAARMDRGTSRLTDEELEEFCKQRGIKVYLPTSAKKGEGIKELTQHLKSLIQWDDKSATVTTETFKRIKDFVLGLKENTRRKKVILTPNELRELLVKKDPKWDFSNEEMLTAVGHLSTHGFITRLKTSTGEPRILLSPELLNNLAASFILEARRNLKGLGSLEEDQLLQGSYKFPELEKLTDIEKDILRDSATTLFLEHHICFRETNPLNGQTFLVFPELINLKKPIIDDDVQTEDGAAYTVSGSIENVYASLVVLLGYAPTFTRTNQWRNQASYEVWQGHICGFRQEEERAGELDFLLYFSIDTPDSIRTLFQSLFENFLARHNLTVLRYEPVSCKNGHMLKLGVVQEQLLSGVHFAFCPKCGDNVTLPRADKPIQLPKIQATAVEADRRAAERRSRFEQVLFHLKNYVTDQKILQPECFISYAWGITEHEQWVEHNLATDMQKAGIKVVLDRWENAKIGASIPRFVERIDTADQVIVIGTVLYRQKYDNNEPMRSFVATAEAELIGTRLIGTKVEKDSVLPVLLEGTDKTAFPPLMKGKVYADFRKPDAYFEVALDLLLSLYDIKVGEPLAKDLRESLKGARI